MKRRSQRRQADRAIGAGQCRRGQLGGALGAAREQCGRAPRGRRETRSSRARSGASRAISASASAGLNAPKPWPAKRASTCCDVSPVDARHRCRRDCAPRAARRGRRDRRAAARGRSCALRIFWAIASSLSVRLIRLMSDGSDLDILALPSRRRHDPRRRAAADERLGRDEQLDVEIGVELDRDVAGQLDMLLLVLADRHVGRLVEQDVGGLEHRIGEQADARRPRGSCPISP